MKKISLILFVFLGFLSSYAEAAKTSHIMKFVFPFGMAQPKVCDTAYRTQDGCCEPPNSIYAHSKRIGCCRQPNLPLTVGTNTRCCVSAAAHQTRWNQTETSPCGQFCTQPSGILTGFGRSSCCPSCTGDRWNQSAADICGNCCTAPSSISYIGTYASCCGALPAGQNRWGQTTSSVCGGYCPPTSSIFTYETFNSCCASCGETIAFQSVGNVCGTCCSRIPESCGNAGIRVCEPDTGSAYCSSDMTKCDPPTDWIAGTSGEGGYDCCATCTGTRYNHTESSCGGCCQPTSEVITHQTSASCCASLPAEHIRWSQTPINICGDYITCGAGAIPNAEGTACVCDTAGGYKGTWKQDTGDGTGNGCITTCGEKMLAAGYSSANFTATGHTITYTGNMIVSSDLDISICDLVVNNDSAGHALTVNGKTLKAKSIKATATAASGIYNSGGMIEAEGDITSEGGQYGINNNGTITAGGVIIGEGGQYGIHNRGSMIEAKGSITGTATGSHTYVYGIDNWSTMISGSDITGTSSGSSGYGIHSFPTGSAITAGGDITGTATGNNGRGIRTSGDITAGGNITGKGGAYGITNSACTIKANIITGEGGYDGIENKGTIIANTIIGTTTGDSGNGITNWINCTITADGDITGTGGTGISNFNGKITTGGNITGKGVSSGIINQNNSTITAGGSITGTATNDRSQGIYNSSNGTITAEKSITGEGGLYGIDNRRDDPSGISGNRGTITAPTIYYCPRTSGGGTFKGTKVKKCP